MRCEQCRAAITARLDSDHEPYPRAAIDAHLRGCDACRDYAALAHRAASQTRTDALVAAVLDRTEATPRDRVVTAVARWSCAALGVAQIAVAIPALIRSDAHGPTHSGRHVAAFSIALGVGLLVAAWRPHRAAGLLPPVATLATALVVTCALDLVTGDLPANAEIHAIAPLGVVGLWFVAHGVRPRARYRRNSGRHHGPNLVPR